MLGLTPISVLIFQEPRLRDSVTLRKPSRVTLQQFLLGSLILFFFWGGGGWVGGVEGKGGEEGGERGRREEGRGRQSTEEKIQLKVTSRSFFLFFHIFHLFLFFRFPFFHFSFVFNFAHVLNVS